MIHSSFMYRENNVFIEEEANPLEKIAIVEKELHGIDIDGIGNLEGLSRLGFIDEKCGNIKTLVDGVELTRNINKKKNPDVLQAYGSPIFCKC